MKKITWVLLLIVMAASLVACGNSGDVSASEDGTSNETAQFSSDDWTSWEFAVNGQLITLPSSMNEMAEIAASVGLYMEAGETSWDDVDLSMYNWVIYDQEQGYEAGNLNGILTSSSETATDDKAVNYFATFVNYDEDVPFDVTLPGNITWEKSDIDDAVALWGEPNDIVEASDKTPLKKYFWYADSDMVEKSGYLELGFYEETGIIGYIHLQCPETMLSMQARLAGEEDWSDSISAQAGDEVEFQIEYTNYSNDQVDDVMIRDILPSGIEYVAGSTYLYNSNYSDGVQLSDDTVTTSGINIGSYEQGGTAYVRFSGKITDDSLDEAENWVNVTVNGEVTAKTSAIVKYDK